MRRWIPAVNRYVDQVFPPEPPASNEPITSNVPLHASQIPINDEPTNEPVLITSVIQPTNQQQSTVQSPQQAKAKNQDKEVRKRARPVHVNEESVRLIDEILKVCDPILEAIVDLQGATNYSMARVVVQISTIKKHLRDHNNEEVHPAIRAFVKESLKTLDEKFVLEREPIALICTMLHPRYKSLGFLKHWSNENESADLIKLAKAELKRECASINPNSIRATPTKPVAELSHLERELQRLEPTMTSTGSSELDRYHNLPCATSELNLTTWWKDNEKHFPTLAQVAMKYLCIPASSASSERIFSAVNLIITTLRNRIFPKTVSDLLFTRVNMKLMSDHGKEAIMKPYFDANNLRPMQEKTKK